MKKIIRKIINLLAKSDSLYLFSKKIVDFHRNENNCNIETNGELNFIKSISNKISVIFDIGANVGDWSNLISGLNINYKIFSFEPSKKTFKILVSNTKDKKNIELFNLGLGDKNEKKIFYNIEGDSTLSSSIDRKTDSKIRFEEQVDFQTLDSFCKLNNIGQISFLKIDVEGSELLVLNGAKSYIKSGKIDYIQFEYGGTYIDADILLKDVFEFFVDKPYTIYKIMQNKIQKINEYSQELENFQYANYIAILNR